MNGFPAREQVDVGVVEVVGVGLGAPDQSARPETVLAGCQSSLYNRADGTCPVLNVLSVLSRRSSPLRNHFILQIRNYNCNSSKSGLNYQSRSNILQIPN